LQPNAKIIIQSIMLVTQKRSSKGDFVKNSSIMERNEAIAQLADGVNVFYLDVNEAIVDESGGMNPAYTTDGVHLKAKYVPLWTEYLKTHVTQ
ncbi:MAG: acylhydrolase, partial [Lachnospiraceae bacterium]|nr:acylhydrolase [Lachnospiraceae bacterium]